MRSSNDLAKLVKQAMVAADGNIEKAATIATDSICEGMKSPNAPNIVKLVNEALKSQIAASTRRRPIPIVGRISNSELQHEIDETLKVITPHKEFGKVGRSRKRR